MQGQLPEPLTLSAALFEHLGIVSLTVVVAADDNGNLLAVPAVRLARAVGAAESSHDVGRVFLVVFGRVVTASFDPSWLKTRALKSSRDFVVEFGKSASSLFNGPRLPV